MKRIEITDEWPDAICDGLSLPCQLCNSIPKFDYRVTDACWNAIVSDRLSRGVICLPCLDVIATVTKQEIELVEVQFTGHGRTIVLKPEVVYSYAQR
jgi:hypothetical protein